MDLPQGGWTFSEEVRGTFIGTFEWIIEGSMNKLLGLLSGLPDNIPAACFPKRMQLSGQPIRARICPCPGERELAAGDHMVRDPAQGGTFLAPSIKGSGC